MPGKLAITIVIALVFSGCASTQMYTPDGYLTEYGFEQTEQEVQAIFNACNDQYPEYGLERIDCFRDWLPLEMRLGPEFAELSSSTLDYQEAVVRGYEAGDITLDTAKQTLKEHSVEYNRERRMLQERYARKVSSRNARVIAENRERQGRALSKLGSDLMSMDQSDDAPVHTNTTCREWPPGQVTCDSVTH